MNELELAISSELTRKYLEAVKLYESELINSKKAPIETYINLAFLYWEFAAEFTFRDANNIPEEWSHIGGEKYPHIVELGLQKYPNSVELHFWEKYFPHRHYFNEFTEEECLKILQDYGDSESLVPYFFLYLFEEEKHIEKRNQLLMLCKELPTAKNTYIRSIIE